MRGEPMRTRVITLRVTEAEYQVIVERGRISDVLRDALEEVGVYPDVVVFEADLPSGPLRCNTPTPSGR